MSVPAAANYDVFKDIITIDEIEDQILANLQNWMGTYMAEICRQKGIDPTLPPAIKSWVNLQKFRHEPQNQTPAIVVVNAGSRGTPTKTGDGWWRAEFMFGVSAIISARDQESATKASKMYAAAVRAIMLQQRKDVSYTDMSWQGETYDDINIGSPDMLAAATGTYMLTLDGLVKSQGAGPKVPSVATPAPVPLVEEDPGRITIVGKE